MIKQMKVIDSTEIFYKWVLPIGTTFLLFFCIGSFIDSQLNINNLVKVQGNIIKYEYFESYSRSSTNLNLHLFLDNGEVYDVTYEWGNKFTEIENALKESTYTEFFHRKPCQTIWRFGDYKNIYQLKIGKVMIFDIHDGKEKSLQLSFITGFFGIAGLTTIIIRRRIKK